MTTLVTGFTMLLPIDGAREPTTLYSSSSSSESSELSNSAAAELAPQL